MTVLPVSAASKPRRARRRALTLCLVLVVVGGALTWRWMLAPPSTPPDRVPPADAIVLFVGGNGERLEAALELVEAGKADVLVIPNGTAPNWPAANALCAGSADVEVICPTPDPDTTRGEARTIGKLAAERAGRR